MDNSNYSQDFGSGSGATQGSGTSGGAKASSTKSYHNGGVEGQSLEEWYDCNLASHYEEGKADGSGSGSGGTKGSGSGGTKGSGSGGTKGSGSGGTKGSGSGGTKGSGSGGTKGSGSGGTKGSGSGGTKGSDPTNDPGGDAKTTYTYQMGEPGDIEVDVTTTPEGSLFFVVKQGNFDGNDNDIDGMLFDVADESALDDLVIYPDENNPAQGDLTDLQVDANGVTGLSNGAEAGGAYDVGLQFGSVPDEVTGNITQTNFTVSSGDGTAVGFEDIDLNNMKVIVNSESGTPNVLGVTNSNAPDWTPAATAADPEPTVEDFMSLMIPVEEDGAMSGMAEETMEDELFI